MSKPDIGKTLNIINTYINDVLKDLNNSNTSTGDIIVLSKFGEREDMIQDLKSLLTKIDDIKKSLHDKILDAENKLHGDIDKMDYLLSKYRYKDVGGKPKSISSDMFRKEAPIKSEVSTEYDFKIVGRTSYPKNQVPPSISPKKSSIDLQKTFIEITDYIGIDAVKIPSFDRVALPGVLYFVESANHFAMKFEGSIFHGNIGRIYTNEHNPSKIKDCKFGAQCQKNSCEYYHDPIKYNNSRDIRNHIASSWMYAPPGSNFRKQHRARTFGNLTDLASDLQGISEEEIEKFLDQMFHDFLCAIILTKKLTRTQK